MQGIRAICAVVLLFTATLFSADSPLTSCAVPGAQDLVVNFHRVDSDLYRGGRPAYKEDVYLQFADLGIRTIINLEGGDEAKQEQKVIERVNKKLEKAGASPLLFISFPIDSFTDTVLRAPEDADIAKLFREIQSAPKPIYIHCQHGKDRTGMAVMLYRIWRGEETYSEAFNEAKYYRFSYWNFGLRRTLDRYRTPEALRSLGDPPATKADGVCKPGFLEQPLKATTKPQVTTVTDQPPSR